MKSNNFLLSVLGDSKSQIKGKNPNSSSKIIGPKVVKDTKKEQRQQRKSGLTQNTEAKKSHISKEIQKLQKKLQQANQNIEQTQKKLDVDLFLKKQKQKRQQYAKDLDKQYQLQKKKRQQKLYKKYNRGPNQQNNDQNFGLQQMKNVKTTFPLQLFKILQTQKNSISKSSWIINSYINFEELTKDEKKMNQLFDDEKITKQQNQMLFNNPNQNYTTASIKKIAQNMLNIHYFPLQIKESQLQTLLEYENLMNALVLMPKDLSQKFYQHRSINNNDFFLCKFVFNGLQKSVITNDLIQTRQFAHKHINIMSKVAGNRNFGPTIIQKCFRKVSANYQNLGLKQAIYTLYGLDAEIIPISNKNYLKENFQGIIKFFIQSGQIVAFLNDNEHNKTIYQDRLYKLKEILKAVQFSDEGKNLNKKQKKKSKKNIQQKQSQNLKKQYKTLYHLQNPWKGLVLDSKGINKFQLLQLFQKFNKIILIRQYPKSWKCKRINLQLFSTGPLSITSNEWTKNNQYNFNISSDINVRIIMRKHLSSHTESILTKDTSKELDYQTNNLYGFLLFSVKEGQQKVTCLKMESLIIKTKSNDLLYGASFCDVLKKGSYIIIPYSNKVTQNIYQAFNLDFFVEKQQAINFGKAIINEWKWVQNDKNQNLQSKNQKVIQSLQSKEVIKKTIVHEVQMCKISPLGIKLQKLLNNLEQSKLILPRDLKLKDLLIPGKILRFLINPDIEIPSNSKQNTKTSNLNKFSQSKQKTKQKNVNTFSDEISAYQKEQALQILLGYDILQGQEINRGLMLTQMQQNEHILDFEHYGLGKDGLTAIMEVLMTYPSIEILNLAHNQLDDSCIVFLCYYLDKSNRVELRQLNISNNNFGKVGMKAIKGLMTRYQKLHVIY